VASQEAGESIGYMSQLIHALVEARAPLRRRLRFEFAGEGDARTCTCVAHVRGDDEPIRHETPPLGRITPKRSPLWKSDPDQQLSYYAARALCRRHFPDILMGVYDRDELEGDVIDQPGGRARDVTAEADALHERLRAAALKTGWTGHAEGFKDGVVEEGLGEAARAPEPAATVVAAPEPEKLASERPKAAKPKPPKTPLQYAKHVAAWLKEYDTEEGVWERWRIEMNLRNACGVTAEEKAHIRASIVDQYIAEIRVR
jgi:hypothetical protein